MLELTCAGCGEPFEKLRREVTRQRKWNPDRLFFCSMSCFGKTKGTGNLDGAARVTAHLSPDNRWDDLSPFRWYLQRARCRKHEVDLDLVHLKSLWEEQRGLCALSGLPMNLPRSTNAHAGASYDPWKASLDRLDHGRGYLKGNVRFVTMMANLCRNGFTDAQLIEFCRAVTARTQ